MWPYELHPFSTVLSLATAEFSSLLVLDCNNWSTIHMYVFLNRWVNFSKIVEHYHLKKGFCVLIIFSFCRKVIHSKYFHQTWAHPCRYISWKSGPWQIWKSSNQAVFLVSGAQILPFAPKVKRFWRTLLWYCKIFLTVFTFLFLNRFDIALVFIVGCILTIDWGGLRSCMNDSNSSQPVKFWSLLRGFNDLLSISDTLLPAITFPLIITSPLFVTPNSLLLASISTSSWALLV